MTAVLKPGDRAVFRSTEGTNRRDGQTVTIDGPSVTGFRGRTPVVWRDGTRTQALTECLTKVPPTPRRVVDEGDLRAVAIGLGMKAADVETLLTLTAVVSAARAS